MPQYLAYEGLTPGPRFLHLPADVAASQNARTNLGSIASACGVCATIAVDDVFLDGAQVKVARGEKVLYINKDHVSTSGAMLLRDRITAAIASSSIGKRK